MPKVYHVKKARKAIPHAGVEVGDGYYHWYFRYGGKRVSKTYPKRSQLTQSKMSEVYSAFEAIEDALSERSIDDLGAAVEDYRSQVETTAQEYRDADEQFGGTGATENAERADALEGFVSEIESLDIDEFLDRLQDGHEGGRDDVWEELEAAIQDIDPDNAGV